MSVTLQPIAPAQLFLVDSTQQEAVIIHYLQTVFCRNNACNTCDTCTLITQKKHHGALWFTPDPRYTIESIADIFKKVEFSLEEHDHMFFIIEQAEALTPTCANSLLKLVEEPPAGYHFIFTTQQVQRVLITIRSRCTLRQTLQKNTTTITIPFLHHFTSYLSDPQKFLKELQAAGLQEITTSAYIDTLITFWTAQFLRAKQENNTLDIARTQALVTLYKEAAKKPIMPGSSKLFWKNLYLEKEEALRHV